MLASYCMLPTTIQHYAADEYLLIDLFSRPDLHMPPLFL